MPYQPTSEIAFYLLSTLKFQMGQSEVKLYGGVKVAQNEFTFALANQLGPEFALPEHEDATKSIADPFGMTGVTLDQFRAAGQIKKVGGTTVANLNLGARARLRGYGLNLEGALVIENKELRLVLVSLRADDQPLTLTGFVSSVLGWNWEWMDAVTRQFALTAGDIYYLSSPQDEWQYDGKTYHSGYHIAARLRLFQSYDFDIRLDADTKNKTVAVIGSVEKLDFDFIKFERPQLQIESKSGSSKFSLSTKNLLVFGTSFEIAASYQAGEFRGRVAKSFDVDIPGLGSSSRTRVDLAVAFIWKSEGFHIIEISGLPTNVLDLAAQFERYLNSLDGGCEKIVAGWLKDLCKTTLKPGLDGRPTKEGGKMRVPLKLTYTLDLAGSSITQYIKFSALFDIPTSLSNLPAALWGSIVNSVPSIVGDILGNEATYKALATACATKYGASAAARFICRALSKFGQGFAQLLAEELGAVAAGDAAAAAELAAVIATLSVSVVRGIVDKFIDWLERIWDKIIGKKEEEERKENAKIETQAKNIKVAMNKVWAQVQALAATQPVTGLKVRVDSDQYVARWMRHDISSRLPQGATLKYELQLLFGSAGDRTDKAWPDTFPRVEPVDRDGVAFPITDIPHYSHYQWNASVRGHVTGITFLSPATDRQLSNAINGLRDSELSAAKDLANQLSADLERLREYQSKGVRTEPVYAVLDMPTLMTVGQSRIGVNTRIKS